MSEVVYLKDYPILLDAHGKQKEVVFNLRKVNENWLITDSLWRKEKALLMSENKELMGYIPKYQKERCRVALFPFVPARGWIKKRCVERINRKKNRK